MKDIFFSLKRIVTLTMFTSLSFIAVYAGRGEEIKSISGIVVNAETGNPVVFANVFLEGTNIGTVTNSEGEFIIKVSTEHLAKNLRFSYIGYEELILAVKDLNESRNKLRLKPSPVPIEEIKVRTDDPLHLIRMALSNIPENYSNEPEKQTAFYRETIKQNRRYVSLAEAILNIYKSAYTSDFDADRIQIFKGRKSRDVERMDTVLFKFQGGPYTSMLLDLVKNPGNILDGEYFEFYNYTLSGFVTIEDRLHYVIEFDQKEDIDFPLYRGKIYLETENLAFSGIEFALSPTGLKSASSELVRKKPLGMKVDPVSANYLVNYTESDGKWYLNHVRSEAVFKCKWKRRLFKSTYTVMAEVAITDRSSENVVKFKPKESYKFSDVFSEEVEYFTDGDFWGEYNIIKPEESIEVAVRRIIRRLEKQLD